MGWWVIHYYSTVDALRVYTNISKGCMVQIMGMVSSLARQRTESFGVN